MQGGSAHLACLRKARSAPTYTEAVRWNRLRSSERTRAILEPCSAECRIRSLHHRLSKQRDSPSSFPTPGNRPCQRQRQLLRCGHPSIPNFAPLSAPHRLSFSLSLFLNLGSPLTATQVVMLLLLPYCRWHMRSNRFSHSHEYGCANI